MSSSSPAKSELHAELQRLRNEIGAKYPLNKLNTSKMNNADVLKMARISELQSELGTNAPLLSANSAGVPASGVPASANAAASSANSVGAESAASGVPELAVPASAAASSANASAPANGAASLPSANAMNTSQPKTTTVKKYKTDDEIIFDDKVRQFMITPELNSKPGQKTVNYELITATIKAPKDCYVSTIQPAKTEGGKTAKSKKSKKRNTHKKK